ncbi:MAG: hypothetical protein E7465_01655 [Ruminococcaceae bacterium]|nr:hypothetical protein [Oscillospiraceae bacterium]
MAQRRKRPNYEFKPDKVKGTLRKALHLTALQQRQLLKWTCYGLLCLFLLIIQDVIMSKVSIFGATTDLVPAAILLIAVISDAYVGSLFAIIASTLFEFSGSAPGPYIIAYLTILAVAAAVFRQSFWRRGFRSNILCAGLALLVYELAVWGTGVFLGLTYWSRIFVFLTIWLLSFLVMMALYPLIRKIQKIGGETWRE